MLDQPCGRDLPPPKRGITLRPDLPQRTPRRPGMDASCLRPTRVFASVDPPSNPPTPPADPHDNAPVLATQASIPYPRNALSRLPSLTAGIKSAGNRRPCEINTPPTNSVSAGSDNTRRNLYGPQAFSSAGSKCRQVEHQHTKPKRSKRLVPASTLMMSYAISARQQLSASRRNARGRI